MIEATRAAGAFPELLRTIRKVFYQHDPSGLFAVGAPEDEHDALIHMVISRLQYLRGSEEVAVVLEAELGGWIASNGKDPKDACSSMAPAIWSAWCVFREKVG